MRVYQHWQFQFQFQCSHHLNAYTDVIKAGLPTLTPRTVIFSTPEAETEPPPELIDKVLI